MAAQDKVARAYLGRLPMRDVFRERLTALFDHERLTTPEKRGARYFFTRNAGLDNQAVLVLRDGDGGPDRVLIDPNSWSEDGAREADAIMVCIDDPKAATQIVELARHEFPQAKLLVRSFDRGDAVELIRAGVDYQIRETVESAYLMGTEGLRALGFAEVDVEEAAEDIRQRDAERLSEQVQGNAMSGLDRLLTKPIPEPLGRASATPPATKQN